jgi:hypothetical protein
MNSKQFKPKQERDISSEAVHVLVDYKEARRHDGYLYT